MPLASEAPESIEGALSGSPRDVLAAMRLALARKLDAGEIASNAVASTYKELRELDRLIRAEDRASEEVQADDEGEDEEFDPLSL